ncbi:MAG: hypothetical protein RIR00_1350 [Pseudomonadota bacterium]|jgi:SAM-dependent methyltransferase
MANNKDLINWKTHAWDDPNMVAWYAGRMVENRGTDPLKRHIETNLIQRWLGDAQDILDVGCGTGRASLPLARRGLRVTGIDSSQAMLDETRRQAGEVPVTLLQGDVAQLPLPDAAFDFLVSLNVVVHFPNWQEIMEEWSRVLRPGGRAVFDIHSRNHYRAALPPEAAAAFIDRGTTAGRFGEFMATAQAEDIIDWADAHGWTVEALIPVGAFLGGGALNQWLATLEHRFDWQRLLSWIPRDKSLLEFCLFLEEEIVARLTPEATCRYFVIARHSPNPAANQALRETLLQRRAACAAGPAGLHEVLPLGTAAFQEELQWHLRAPRNRQLLYRLLQAIRRHLPGLDFAALLPEAYAQLFEDWEMQDQIDQAGLEIARNWSRCSEAGQVLTSQGIPLATGLEYNLMESLLTHHFGVFSGTRS